MTIKHILFAWLACLTVFTAAFARENISPNLIQDGGFEEWEVPRPGTYEAQAIATALKNGWSFSKDEDGNILYPRVSLLGYNGVLKRETKDVHNGKNSLRLLGSCYLGVKSDAGKTAAGDEYIVRYWVKGEGLTKVYFHVNGKDKPQALIVEEKGKPEKDKWSLIEQRMKIAGKGAETINPRVWTSAEMLVDDIFVARVLKEEARELKEIEPEYSERIAFAAGTTLPVKIDGRLDEKAWQDAVKFGGFRYMVRQTAAAPLQSCFRVLFDKDNIYLGIENMLPDCKNIYDELRKNPIKHRDKVITPDTPDTYTDRHSNEIFLKAPGSEKYKQIVVALDGYKYDGLDVGERNCAAWNGSWEYAIGVDKDKWCLEMRVPAKDMELREITDLAEWRMNVVRNLEGNYATWAAVGGDFHTPSKFGRLIIGGFQEWRRKVVDSWPERGENIKIHSTKTGEDYTGRLALIDAFKGLSPAEPENGEDWRAITEDFSRIVYIDQSYRNIERELEYLKLLKQTSAKYILQK